MQKYEVMLNNLLNPLHLTTNPFHINLLPLTLIHSSRSPFPVIHSAVELITFSISVLHVKIKNVLGNRSRNQEVKRNKFYKNLHFLPKISFPNND